MTGSGQPAGTGRPSSTPESVSARVRDAVAYCAVPTRLRRTVTITVVVGTTLTLLNQGDVIFGGSATGITANKTGLNFLVPFMVSNLGLLSGRGDASADESA